MNNIETVLEELNRRLDPKGRNKREDFLDLVPKIECANGLKLSVQASHYHYCSPRESDGFWYQVEVGFPTVKVDKLMPFAEEQDRPTETVYGYVPIKIVAEVIADNGGFKP